jgi:hypothetical protein
VRRLWQALWHMDGVDTAARIDVAGPPRLDHEAVEAFLVAARAVADWQQARAEAFERKAQSLLGFSGVLLVLLPTLWAPISRTRSTDTRHLLEALALLAVVLLALAAVAAALTLRRRRYANIDLEQLRAEWTTYRHRARRTAPEVLGLLADQLICGSTPVSPLESLQQDTKTRGRWMARAMWLLVAGIAVLAGLVGVLLVSYP